MRTVSDTSSLRSLSSASRSDAQAPQAPLAQSLAHVRNTSRATGSWEAEHAKTSADKQRTQLNLITDQRVYPKSHDQYDLAALAKGGSSEKSRPNDKALTNDVFTAPKVKKDSDFSSRPPVDRTINSRAAQVSAHSASKYDTAQVGLVGAADMKQRIARYENNKILPDFIHNFFTKETDAKFQAFLKHPEQFPATRFSPAGAMVLMPNVKYIENNAEAFPQPGRLAEQTRQQSGFALVGYWVPPSVFEGSESFRKVFGEDAQATKGFDARETVGQYNARTGTPFVVTPLDVRKEHLPMLQEFQEMSLKNLQDVYGFDPKKDKVQMYLHFPIYGDATAGLHVHVRVNQRLPAGEADANSVQFDKLLKVLEDDSIPDNAVSQHLLDSSARTRSGQHISFSAAWGKDQFHGLDVKYIPNPWKRPQV